MVQRGTSFDAKTFFENELTQQRALEALLSPRQVVVKSLSIAHIRPNPFQVRQKFRDLDKLTTVLREHGFGPCLLHVRPAPSSPNMFQLVFGERWLQAARNAALRDVPCEIAAFSDTEMFEVGMVENIRRADLDPLEEAFVFRSLLEQHTYSLPQLAERIGKEARYIHERLEMLTPPGSEPLTTLPNADQNAHHPPVARAVAEPPTTGESRWAPAATADTATRTVPANPAPQAPTSEQFVKRTIERDMRTLRGVFARWHNLVAQRAEAQPILKQHLDEVVREVEQLTANLQSPSHTRQD